jgi:hypothetical protein
MLLLLCCLIPAGAVGESFTIAPFSPQTMEITSNRHAQPDDARVAVPFLDLEGFEPVAQTEAAALYLNREMGTLRLVDQQTGYIWGAIPLADARNLNKSWKSYAASLVGIECYDAKNNEKRYGMAEETVLKTYHIQPDGFDCDVDFTELGVSMTVQVRLTENQLRFAIDEATIRETGDFKLKSITFMPFLGSVYEDETPGWFLLPDGSGALMRFQKSGKYIAGYDKRVYGGDLSVSTAQGVQSMNAARADDYAQPEAQVLLPVYGIAHGVGQNGLLCVIDGGAMYASIAATPAGMSNMKYNSIGARFEMRQKYNMASTQSGAGIATPQEEINHFSPALTVHVLSGAQADYDQMAVYYRSLLNLPAAEQGEASMRVEVYGRDAKDSLLPGETIALTTLAEAQGIADDLMGAGVDNLTMVLSHYTKKNKAGEALSIGTMEELTALRDALAAGGGNLLLRLDPVTARDDQINLRLQAANGMNLSPIRITRENAQVMYRDTYFFRPAQVQENIRRTMNRYPAFAFAVEQLPTRLYGDYTTGREGDRAQNAAQFQQYLDELPAPALYTPNLPMLGGATQFFDAPLVSGQYLYETDTVPFLPIVLGGHMELYATSLNLGTFSRDRMLRMAEYGIRPSFVVTEAESVLLFETPLADANSTCYRDWRDFILETWAYLNPAMEATGGRAILSHTLEAQGRVRVTFEGDVHLLVNYTDAAWHAPEGMVPPHDYWVGGMAQ